MPTPSEHSRAIDSADPSLSEPAAAFRTVYTGTWDGLRPYPVPEQLYLVQVIGQWPVWAEDGPSAAAHRADELAGKHPNHEILVLQVDSAVVTRLVLQRQVVRRSLVLPGQVVRT